MNFVIISKITSKYLLKFKKCFITKWGFHQPWSESATCLYEWGFHQPWLESATCLYEVGIYKWVLTYFTYYNTTWQIYMTNLSWTERNYRVMIWWRVQFWATTNLGQVSVWNKRKKVLSYGPILESVCKLQYAVSQKLSWVIIIIISSIARLHSDLNSQELSTAQYSPLMLSCQIPQQCIVHCSEPCFLSVLSRFGLIQYDIALHMHM